MSNGLWTIFLSVKRQSMCLRRRYELSFTFHPTILATDKRTGSTQQMNIRFSIFYLDNYWGGFLDKSLLPVTVSFESMTFTYDSADDEVRKGSRTARLLGHSGTR